MKTLILLLISTLLISCEARLDDDTRAFFKTRIVDSSGSPLRNATVEVSTFRTFELIPVSQDFSKFSEPDRNFILGKGVTDQNGDVSFLLLFDTSNKYFVNITAEDGDFDVVTTGIESFNDNLTLEIPLITIKDVADVELNFFNTSGSAEVFDVEVNYFATYCNEFYENSAFILDENCAFQNEIMDRFNENANDGKFEFQAFYPSIINVYYTDESGNEFMREFTLNNPTERFEINY